MKRTGFVTVMVLAALFFTSCKSFDTMFKSQESSILYIVRNDGRSSRNDRAQFFLNGKKIVNLGPKIYAALHLKAGKYSARWKISSTDGTVRFDKDYGTIIFKPGVAYGCAVNYTFRKWRAPFKYFDKNIQGAIRREGGFRVVEMDLRNAVKPLR